MAKPEDLLEEAEKLTHEAWAVGMDGRRDDARTMLRDARDVLERARTQFTAAGDQPGEAKVFRRLGHLEGLAGRREHARSAYGQAQELSQRIGDREGEAKALFGLGLMECMFDRGEAAREAFRNARRLYREMGDAKGEAMALSHLALDEDGEDAKRAYEEACRIYRKAKCPEEEARTLGFLARTYRELGEADKAGRAVDRAREIYNQLPYSDTVALELSMLGNWEAIAGAEDQQTAIQEDVQRLLQDAQDQASGEQTPEERAFVLTELASTESSLGNREAARAAYDKALEIYRRIGDRSAEAATLSSKALMEGSAGETDAARLA